MNINTQDLYHYGVLGMKWGIRKANRYKAKMLNKSQKKAELANKASKEAKTVLDDLNKHGKKSIYFSKFDYKTLKDAKVDYSLSVSRSAIVGKTWLSVNKTLNKTDANTISKSEMTKMVKDIIENGKKEARGWVYY